MLPKKPPPPLQYRLPFNLLKTLSRESTPEVPLLHHSALINSYQVLLIDTSATSPSSRSALNQLLSSLVSASHGRPLELRFTAFPHSQISYKITSPSLASIFRTVKPAISRQWLSWPIEEIFRTRFSMGFKGRQINLVVLTDGKLEQGDRVGEMLGFYMPEMRELQGEMVFGIRVEFISVEETGKLRELLGYRVGKRRVLDKKRREVRVEVGVSKYHADATESDFERMFYGETGPVAQMKQDSEEMRDASRIPESGAHCRVQ
ncbi:hypothetical protein FPQ18DRAFT_163107 [Pyronema domesticum]|nr:hypothetical protein FPQ18DRAFT_163107 [Pyronema domesticum]